MGHHRHLLQQNFIPISYFKVSRLFSDESDGPKFKNDPDVKKLVSELHKDFENKQVIKDSENDKELNSDNDTKNSKNVSQLLTELYGETEKSSASQNENYSSVGGYKEYSDLDSEIIYDIDEEREILRKAFAEGKEVDFGKRKKTSPAVKYKHLKGRGERGVFELHEIVELLRNEKVSDLAVISIPADRQYADYMLVGTASSKRHIRTVCSLIVSVFKQKMWLSDPVPRIEGMQDKDSGWNALDMGNIVVHILTQEMREYYDLETLWTVGPEFDDKTRTMESAGDVGNLSALEELMKTDFDISLLHEQHENPTNNKTA